MSIFQLQPVHPPKYHIGPIPPRGTPQTPPHEPNQGHMTRYSRISTM